MDKLEIFISINLQKIEIKLGDQVLNECSEIINLSIPKGNVIVNLNSQSKEKNYCEIYGIKFEICEKIEAALYLKEVYIFYLFK